MIIEILFESSRKALSDALHVHTCIMAWVMNGVVIGLLVF